MSRLNTGRRPEATFSTGYLSRPATKCSLGALARHSGKTIDSVVNESIELHLCETSFKSASDIGGFVKSIGVDPQKVGAWLPELEEMIKRRHHIAIRPTATKARAKGNTVPVDLD